MDLIDPFDAAENAARTSYGRLLALLAARSGDIAEAEDSLADAFERALRTWPRDGIPVNPDGWLLTTARNRQRDLWKSSARRTSVPLDSAVDPKSHLDDIDPDAIEDKRLQLLLVCAHPAIEPMVRTPLMLDVVLGYTAKEIAGAFALPSSTLAARLVRAKKRTREKGVSFEIPERSALPERIDAVMAAVYGAFAIDWHSTGTEVREGLATEALHLAEVLCTLVPDDAEAHGLAALICLSTARLPARYTDDTLVPLDEQDPTLWDDDAMTRGEDHLRVAHALVSRGSPLGRFQMEAAIQAVHCSRRTTGRTDWDALLELHTALQRMSPTLGGAVALAAAVAEVRGPACGLVLLDEVDGAARFQPAWAVRAHLLERVGRFDSAATAYAKSISLSPDVPTRRYLQARLDAIGGTL